MTTVPRSKAALRARIESRLAGVSVYRGYVPESADDKYVCVGDAEAKQGWAALGRQSREETYEIKVWLLHLGAADSPEEAAQGAYQMLAELEALLRDDPTLGLTPADGVRAITAELASWKDDEGPAPRGHYCQIEARVKVTARV